ncbi:MAG: choice-of-anchor L domain-containing protein [Bacteroidales bacterium]|nr:choice-of-anchor L domain-containing protein [Bacteroidales bacterium]
MKKNTIFQKFFALAFLLVIFATPIQAQIVVNNYTSLSNAQIANALVDSLMGNGVTFSNASFQGVRSSSTSYGYQACYFTTTGTTQTQMAIAKGVALTSGNTNLISIPIGQDPASSNSFSKGYLSTAPGELRKTTSPINDLTVLAGPVNWFNAAILEFDFIPAGDSIVFNYVFGSEEYSDNTNFTNYQCTEYNDKFGFLISGPGILGGAGFDNNARNIARLANGSEVGINSVNNGTVGSSASPNGASYCQNTNPSWVLNNPVNEYFGPVQGTSPNGNTKLLKAAKGGLIPGATYHIKLLILDAKDGAYDAIVYIEAGSFTSPQPGLSLSANPSSICQGSSTYVVANQSNGSAPFNYTWSNSIIHNTSSIKDSVLVSPSVTTTYSLTVTDANSQTATASIVITVNPNPIATAASNSPICQGSNLNLTVNTGTSWSWVGPNGFTSTSQNPVITAVPTTASGTYTVTVTNAQGCTGTASVIVTVNPKPVPTGGSNSPICQGSNLNLTVNTGISWNWTGPNSYTSTVQYPVLTAAPTAASGTYTVTVTNAQGCTGSTSVVVAVNPKPVPMAGSNSPICQGNNLNLSINTGTSWNWAGPNSFTSAVQNPVISSAPSSAAGTYTVTVTNAQGCTGSTSVIATVNPKPFPIAGSNSPICQGNNLNLTVNTGISWNWTGPNGFTSSLQNPSISSATPAATGTYTVTVTNAQGCSASNSINVSVNNFLAATAGSNSPVCHGNSLNLTVNSGNTWNWTGPNGFTSQQQNPVINNVAPQASGTYTVTVTNIQGCTGTASVNIAVNTNPAPIAGSNNAICQGSTLNLTVNTGTSWIWAGPNGFTSNVQNPVITNASTASSGTYTVTVTNAQGCTGIATTNATVNSNPSPTIGSNSPVCQGNTLNLTSGTASAWSWTGPNGFTSTSQNPIINNITSLASGSYTLTVTNSQGCSGTVTTNVIVNALPLVIAGSNSPVCIGNNLSLSVNTGVSWNWAGPGGFNSTSQNPSINSVTPVAGGTYTVTVTNNQGCSTSSSTIVSLNSNPVALAGSNSPICEGNSLNLHVNTGTSWNWSGPDNFSSTLQNPIINSTNLSAAGTYSVTVTDANGCTGNSSLIATISPAPLLVATAFPSEICLGSQTTISSGGGFLYVWNTGDIDESFTASPLVTSTYTVSGTDNLGCTGTAQVQVIVHPNPTVSITPSQPAICEGEDIVITAVSNGLNPQFLWNNNNTSASLTVSPVINTPYSVVVTDVHGCTGEVTTSVNVNPLPDVDFEADPLSGCVPHNVSFSSLSSASNSHNWNFGDNFSNNLTNPEHLYLISGIYSVTLTVTSSTGCSNTITKNNYIEVYPKPTASFYTSTNITDEFESEISFVNQSSGATSWFWLFGEGNNDSISQEENPIYTYNSDGEYGVWLYVENQYGCSDSISKDILIKPLTTFYIPNSFSPNGDGINDYFGPVGVGFDTNSFEMYIYDRWGKLIFMTEDINYLWDGRISDTGNMAGQDVYSWVIFFNKPNKSESHLNRYIGSVILLR